MLDVTKIYQNLYKDDLLCQRCESEINEKKRLIRTLQKFKISNNSLTQKAMKKIYWPKTSFKSLEDNIFLSM